MLIHSWIMNSDDEYISISILFLENPIDIWDGFRERFSHGNCIRISELQHDIFGSKQECIFVYEFFYYS